MPEEKKFQDRVEEWADGIVETIDYNRLKVWKEVFFHPTKTLTDEKPKADLKRGAKDVFIASLPSLLLGLVMILLVVGYFAVFGLLFVMALFREQAVLYGLGGIVAGIILVILYFLSPIIGWLLTSALQYVIAKVLGGKANFKTHAYLLALAYASGIAAQIPFLIASMIPCIGYVAAPFTTIISFYAIYLQYKGVKIAHNIDTIRAAFVVIAPIAVIGIAAFILYFILTFGIFSLQYL